MSTLPTFALIFRLPVIAWVMTTQQAQAVRALPAATRIALTGTPVENRLSELWSIMEFTNPGLLGPAERFRERFAVPIERNGSDDAAAALQRLTRPFVLRRLKTDKTIISDLPDKQEMKVWCNLTPEQASLYAATVAQPGQVALAGHGTRPGHAGSGAPHVPAAARPGQAPGPGRDTGARLSGAPRRRSRPSQPRRRSRPSQPRRRSRPSQPCR